MSNSNEEKEINIEEFKELSSVDSIEVAKNPIELESIDDFLEFSNKVENKNYRFAYSEVWEEKELLISISLYVYDLASGMLFKTEMPQAEESVQEEYKKYLQENADSDEELV